MRGAPRGDNIDLTIGIEICQPDILAGHGIVVNPIRVPSRRRTRRRNIYFDPNLLLSVGFPPTGNDLIPPDAQQVRCSQGVTLIELFIKFSGNTVLISVHI